MKNSLIAIIAAASIFLDACTKETAEHDKFVHKLDSLHIVLRDRDSTINDLFSSIDEIKQNLDSVAIRQNIISTEVEKQKGEVKGNIKEHINYQIAAINDLMNKNRKKIEELNNKLKKYSIRIDKFQKMVAGLNEEIAQKSNELQSLNEKLSVINAQVAELQTSIGTLTTANTSQSQLIAEQTTSLHTAYFLVGKSKDLQAMNVIAKKGGVLGMGKTTRLNSDINNTNFTKIDYTEVISIPINSKKAEIITNHPSGSYILDKNEKGDEYTELRITQPESFWSASKYLVVAI